MPIPNQFAVHARSPEDMRACHNANGRCPGPLSTAAPLMLEHSSHSSQLSSAEVLVSSETLTVGYDSQNLKETLGSSQEIVVTSGCVPRDKLGRELERC